MNVFPEARTSEIICKPNGRTKPAVDPRLTTGSSPAYPRFISGTRSALSSWLLTSGPTPFCLCKLFSCKACPGKTRTYHGRFGTGRRTVGRRGGGGTGRVGRRRVGSPRKQPTFLSSKRFLDMSCIKKYTRQNKRRYAGQQPGTKSGRGPADKPVVNRTFCSSTGLNGISIVRASEESFRTVVFDALETKRVCRLLGESSRRRPAPSRPATPPRAAQPRPARGMSGFWIRQIVKMFLGVLLEAWEQNLRLTSVLSAVYPRLRIC